MSSKNIEITTARKLNFVRNVLTKKIPSVLLGEVKVPKKYCNPVKIPIPKIMASETNMKIVINVFLVFIVIQKNIKLKANNSKDL